jgi:hypothetical protein
MGLLEIYKRKSGGDASIPTIPGYYMSLRTIVTGYTGALIRVQRDSDSTELDIFADGSGDLDTTALATFVGANNGYVVTWYDQYGTNHATETSTVQAKIVDAGTLVTLNALPAILFSSLGTLQIPAGYNPSFINTVSFYCVYQAPAVNGSNIVTSGAYTSYRYISSNRTQVRNNGLSYLTTGAYPSEIQRLISYNSDGSNLTMYWQAVSKGSQAIDGYNNSLQGVGASGVYMQEIQYILDDLTADNTTKMAEINAYYTIY